MNKSQSAGYIILAIVVVNFHGIGISRRADNGNYGTFILKLFGETEQ